MNKKNVWIASTLVGIGICVLWPLLGFGDYHPGVLCAKCIDQCASWGSQADCTTTTTCVYGNPLFPPDGTDFWICIQKFNSSPSLTVSIGMCSPTTSDHGGTLIYCADTPIPGAEQQPTCGFIWSCECRDQNHCEVWPEGAFEDWPDCELPEEPLE